MGTRALVKIEKVSCASLYIHWDGYPTHLLPWLQAFNEKFTSTRGDDTEYKFAQLIRSSVSMAEEFNLNTDDTLGFGLCAGTNHSGCDYVYTLKADGTVSHKAVD